MTRTRAATSVSLTIGAAVATLVVVGGILAGPTILDRAHQGGSVGACLRGRLDQSGLIAPQPPPETPAVTSEPPARETGWIEANATEYEAPPPASADLLGPAGAIGATGSLAATAPARAGVAVAPGTGDIDGGGAVLGPNGPDTDVALAGPAGHLVAAGALPVPDMSVAISLARPQGVVRAGSDAPSIGPQSEIAALEAPAGLLSVTGAEGASLTAGAAADASSVPLPDVGGRVGSTAIAAGVTLEAALQPAPDTPELVAVEPAIPLTTPRPEPAAPVAVSPPKRPKYNPRYPNVIVLPPPNTGSNSSFATLELR